MILHRQLSAALQRLHSDFDPKHRGYRRKTKLFNKYNTQSLAANVHMCIDKWLNMIMPYIYRASHSVQLLYRSIKKQKKLTPQITCITWPLGESSATANRIISIDKQMPFNTILKIYVKLISGHHENYLHFK